MNNRVKLILVCTVFLTVMLAAASPANAETMPFQTMPYEKWPDTFTAVAGQPHTFQFWVWHPDPTAVVTSGEIVFYRYVDVGETSYHEFAGSVSITGIDHYTIETDWSSPPPPNAFVWPEVALPPGEYEWFVLVTVDGVTNTSYAMSEQMRVYPPVAIDDRAPYTRDTAVTVTYDHRANENYFQITNSLSDWPDTWQQIPAEPTPISWILTSEGEEGSQDGQQMVFMRFAETPGGPSTTWSSSITLDTTGPVTKAPVAATVIKGRSAKLRYEIYDLFSPWGPVTIKIRKSGQLVKTLKCGEQTFRWTYGASHTRSFRCTLARGTYKFSVYAVDLAGNKQSKVGSNTLVVK